MAEGAGERVPEAAGVSDESGGATERAALRRVEREFASGAADVENTAEQFGFVERGVCAGQRIAFGDEHGASVAPGFANDTMSEETAFADEEHNIAGVNARDVFAADGKRVTRTQPGPHTAAENAERDRAAGTENVGEKFSAETRVVRNEFGGLGDGEGFHAGTTV